ncbi:AbgT family transporter [Pelistega indica]|uniref:AbgT family transporter n=1 Tax=Pelistega indica TaxID=1414851 RepID=UPI0003F7D0F3|nr:AbgT family transporter [Pelistega indica]
MPSPFLKAFVPILFGFFITLGITYGKTVGKITKLADIPAYMVEAVKELATTLVLFFVIAQFIAYFNWSNLGQYIAIQGSVFLVAYSINWLLNDGCFCNYECFNEYLYD